MMRHKVENLGEGLHPSEIIVSVPTRTGPEELTLDPRSLRDNTLTIGWPVGADGGYRLVELPRPTSRGQKRVWVKQDDLVADDVDRIAV